ncbi:MAG: MFS transporter, partial [Novosphingobium sp.]|nr:MFS transporter [Novosphingobium sp.]
MAEVSTRAAWTTVGVLTLAYVFSYLDRQILVLLVGPVRADLQIGDTAFSLLAGAAFALFYAVMALPLAVIADRGSRKRLILAGVAVWGSMTILCGLSTSFAMLFFARMGVGIGEAALTPTAYSLIADLFAPEKRGRAMGVFTTATFL